MQRQKDLADESGISLTVIQQIEKTGDMAQRTDVIFVALAYALQVRREEIEARAKGKSVPPTPTARFSMKEEVSALLRSFASAVERGDWPVEERRPHGIIRDSEGTHPV